MNRNFNQGPNINPKQESEPDFFMQFSNTEELRELVPKLELPTLENFSTLSLEAQKNLIKDVQDKKKAEMKEWDILYYVVSAIKAFIEFESISVIDSDTKHETLPDKNLN